ncbi:MAG: ribosome maturation factor RimM [Gammaproteobacteria bacterium]|nr:ribosome maturation factor RimM [Gammaproteobacteria bacterium]
MLPLRLLPKAFPSQPRRSEPITSRDGLILGRIHGLYGVKGWVKVFSYTEPKENILNYSPWLLRRQMREVLEGRIQGKGIIARLADCADRDQATALLGAEIYVPRERFSPLEAGEYYWTDLIGLTVINREGTTLGRVQGLLETGANDVLAVLGERERLLPFVPDRVVLEVNLAQGFLKVDWDPEY